MKYAKFSDDFLSNFRLDDNGETLVLTDKSGYTRAVKLLPYNERTKGKWKLVSDINNNIDIVCPFCNTYRIIGYAHGYSIEEVKSQLKEVNDLPNYCEHCGAEMGDRR